MSIQSKRGGPWNAAVRAGGGLAEETCTCDIDAANVADSFDPSVIFVCNVLGRKLPPPAGMRDGIVGGGPLERDDSRLT